MSSSIPSEAECQEARSKALHAAREALREASSALSNVEIIPAVRHMAVGMTPRYDVATEHIQQARRSLQTASLLLD